MQRTLDLTDGVRQKQSSLSQVWKAERGHRGHRASRLMIPRLALRRQAHDIATMIAQPEMTVSLLPITLSDNVAASEALNDVRDELAGRLMRIRACRCPKEI